MKQDANKKPIYPNKCNIQGVEEAAAKAHLIGRVDKIEIVRRDLEKEEKKKEPVVEVTTYQPWHVL